MQIESKQDAGLLGKNPKTITVTVNERPVTFLEQKATGLEIKQTAIKQGVAIQEDFVLFEVKGNSPLKQIGDCETVNLHEKQKFRATAPDDNS
ncbi:multiubiquitin domain-containing protein [Nostoc sp. FACHB-190]|uniref:multiubiquitin domain-containing protein n=1 Tax=Nostoc sp. FACHB-190 TaxID=2692838 RepID=UPI001685A646|nr:multiubiquitin domain-containing protein [Nostoc sp. FACHB-190]MBD2302323.1 multiubiquitin domain-containing protein [Nostoc sp. FACHB-190]